MDPMETAQRNFLDAQRRWNADEKGDFKLLEVCSDAEQLLAVFFEGWKANTRLKNLFYSHFRKALVENDRGSIMVLRGLKIWRHRVRDLVPAGALYATKYSLGKPPLDTRTWCAGQRSDHGGLTFVTGSENSSHKGVYWYQSNSPTLIPISLSSGACAWQFVSIRVAMA
jgi:hypothetical protein